MKRISNQKGQSLVEYLVIVALVGVSAIAIMRTVGQTVDVQFTKVAMALGARTKAPALPEVNAKDYRKRDLKNFMSGAIGKSGGTNGSDGESSDGSSED